MTKKARHPFHGLFPALLLAVGCQQAPTQVEPAPGAATTGAEDTTVRRSGDVTLTAEGDAWDGSMAVNRAVTPLRVEIHNERDGDLLLRYESFEITTEGGETYAALPPWNIEEEGTAYVAVHDYEPIATPGFRYGGS